MDWARSMWKIKDVQEGGPGSGRHKDGGKGAPKDNFNHDGATVAKTSSGKWFARTPNGKVTPLFDKPEHAVAHIGMSSKHYGLKKK